MDGLRDSDGQLRLYGRRNLVGHGAGMDWGLGRTVKSGRTMGMSGFGASVDLGLGRTVTTVRTVELGRT